VGGRLPARGADGRRVAAISEAVAEASPATTSLPGTTISPNGTVIATSRYSRPAMRAWRWLSFIAPI
jgi:hypothetical protein